MPPKRKVGPGSSSRQAKKAKKEETTTNPDKVKVVTDVTNSYDEDTDSMKITNKFTMIWSVPSSRF